MKPSKNKSRKEVVFITSVDLSGRDGASIATRELLRALVNHNNIQFHVILPSPTNKLNSELFKSIKNVEFIEQTKDGKISRVAIQYALFKRLKYLHKCHDIDAVITRFSSLMLAPPLVSRYYNIPHISLLRGSPSNNQSSTVTDLAIRFVHTTNLSLSDRILKAYENIPIPIKYASKTQILPNGVDPMLFDPIPTIEARKLLQPDIQLSQDDFVIGFVGSLSKRHRLELLFKAMYKIEDEIRCKLLIVGEGPEREKLEQLATAFGISSKIHWAGFVEHSKVPSYLSATDVCYSVIDSNNPSNPIKCYEYLSLEKPVIATESAELSFISENNFGVCVESLDLANISKSIQILFDISEKRRNNMGSRGRKYIFSNHTWAKRAEQITKEIDKLCG